jgi:hypothetical protein
MRAPGAITALAMRLLRVRNAEPPVDHPLKSL